MPPAEGQRYPRAARRAGTSVQRGAAARLIQFHVAHAPVAVNGKDEINARAPRRARIHFVLVPIAGHLALLIWSTYQQTARKIVVAHRGRPVGARLHLDAASPIPPARRTAPVFCCGGGWCCCVFGVFFCWGFTCLPRIGIAVSSTRCFSLGSAGPAPGWASPWPAHSGSADRMAAAARAGQVHLDGSAGARVPQRL